jgi:hypothetical protein
MTSESAGRDKYTAGGVLVNGHIAHGGSQTNNTPGPGHYHTNSTPHGAIYGSGASLSPHNTNSSVNTRGGMQSTSSRMLLPSASLKNGVLFHGKIDDHSHIGPGHYYNSEHNNLIKKSFNARVTSPRSPRSPRGRSSPGSEGSYGGSPPQYSQNGYAPKFVHGGEFSEAHLYDDNGGYDKGQDDQDFYHRDQHEHEAHTPIQAPQGPPHSVSDEKPKSKRKPGRMTIMESMVPSMFRKKN